MFNLRHWFGKKSQSSSTNSHRSLDELIAVKDAIERVIALEKQRIVREYFDFVESVLNEDDRFTVMRSDTFVKCIALFSSLELHLLEFYYAEGVGLCWKMYSLERQNFMIPSYRIKLDRSAIQMVAENLAIKSGAV